MSGGAAVSPISWCNCWVLMTPIKSRHGGVCSEFRKHILWYTEPQRAKQAAWVCWDFCVSGKHRTPPKGDRSKATRLKETLSCFYASRIELRILRRQVNDPGDSAEKEVMSLSSCSARYPILATLVTGPLPGLSQDSDFPASGKGPPESCQWAGTTGLVT